MTQELAPYEQGHVTRQTPELNMEIIKKYICPKATDQEAYTFLQLCKAQGLNPFLREAYLIKYGDEAATIVTGKETFTKRADRLPQYDGFKAGIILLSNKEVVYREGSFFVNGEALLGGWAEVYRKDRSIPFRNEVKLEEYIGKKKDGSITKMWREKPGTMIRKVPLMQSLREAFPDEFGGMYSPEEISTIDTSAMPTYEVGQSPKIPLPESDKLPIQAPQQKSRTTPTVDGNTVTGVVETVSVKTGKGKKGDWTKYGIKIGEEWYGTFDKKIGETAESLKGSSVSLIWKQEGEYKTCEGIKPEDSIETTFEPVPGCSETPDKCADSLFGDGAPGCGKTGTDCPNV